MTDTPTPPAEATDGRLPARACCASFVVRDIRGAARPKLCATRDEASRWLRHLFEARPDSRCVIEEVPSDYLPTDNTGRLYCWNCWFELQKHDPKLHNAGEAEVCDHCGKSADTLAVRFRHNV
jgi:hypothetical protein